MTEIDPLMRDTIILLTGAVVAAPIFKRIGLGTVLGYLAAGIVIGPVAGIILDGEKILHFAEIGIILFLFVIGLELKPTRLWSMRRDIFGLGATQVLSCGVVLTVVVHFLLFSDFATAFIVGFGLALSSTAFALQMLESAGDTNTAHGRKAFTVLLFQDLAIIPLLALIPFLSSSGGGDNPWVSAALGLGSILLVALAGRYLLNPIFGIIARTGAREVMIAAALLVVLGAAGLMQFAGLSMALGAFFAGVMLAESSYRHELEADIEPFRGIFLGLFFLAIGLSLDLSVIGEHWLVIAVAVPVALIIKAVLIYGSARLFNNSHSISIRVASVISQHGEFGFVLFAAASAAGILEPRDASILISIVVCSMVLTPLTVTFGEWVLSGDKNNHVDEVFPDLGANILMIGFSRMGQVASQSLLAAGNEVTMIDANADRIKNAAEFGFRVYFGDGTRRDVLRAAGIEDADIVVVTTHNRATTNNIVDVIQREFPNKKIYARAYDRAHALDLIERDVKFQIRETFESAMVLGKQILIGLGHHEEEAEDIIADVRRLDQERLSAQQLEGRQAGMHLLHTEPAKPVRPEPLIEPRHDGEALDERSEKLLANKEPTKS